MDSFVTLDFRNRKSILYEVCPSKLDIEDAIVRVATKIKGSVVRQ